MKMKIGVYQSTKKDGTIYYRSSITYKNKHISLGSYNTEALAHTAYTEARDLLSQKQQTIDAFSTNALSFEKAISLLNFRDSGIYTSNPIYVQKNYFRYYLSKDEFLTFDIDDLFYYSNHKIMKRGNHLFVADYGMQVSIQSRYGIRSHAKCGRDYLFKNGDSTDYRYSNIEIINRYHGVTKQTKNAKTTYKAVIHVNGNFVIGTYSTEEKAAIAYNKAADILHANGVTKTYPVNYIEGLPASKYADLYANLKISDKIISYCSQ